jgi:amidase
MSELVFLSASQLAKAIRKREVSVLEVLEVHLEHIARHNLALNAIVTLDKERALARAKEADEALQQGELWGVLHGVPFTVKDNFETAGLLTTCSYQPLINYIPQKDASVITCLRSAGAIILGKTNIPRLAADIQTKSPLFGRANNPWNLNCTPGGSTGGGAAAVAAGLSPLEIANDSAGSIRIPAHFCGVFGLKPTEHRVSMAGQIPPLPGRSRSLRHLQVAGAIARSVEDLRLCLSLIEGPDLRQWEIPPITEAFLKPRPLREYRFAWTNDFNGVPITSSTRAALELLAHKLTQLGCKVERLNPPGFDFTQAWETFGEIAATELYAKESPLALFLWKILSLFPSSIIPGGPIARGSVRGAGLSMRINSTALMRRDDLITVMDRFFDNWDAWLCPVSPTSAFTHRWTGKLIDVDGQNLSYLMAACAYTSVLNLTGNPVVVLPVGQTEEGLPIGVQLVGRRWRDMDLLNIAEKLTEVTGSFQRPPGY